MWSKGSFPFCLLFLFPFNLLHFIYCSSFYTVTKIWINTVQLQVIWLIVISEILIYDYDLSLHWLIWLITMLSIQNEWGWINRETGIPKRLNHTNFLKSDLGRHWMICLVSIIPILKVYTNPLLNGVYPFPRGVWGGCRGVQAVQTTPSFCLLIYKIFWVWSKLLGPQYFCPNPIPIRRKKKVKGGTTTSLMSVH